MSNCLLSLLFACDVRSSSSGGSASCCLFLRRSYRRGRNERGVGGDWRHTFD